MCESGAWKSYDELEENLTLDDLFMLYEKTSERQMRLIKALGAIYGSGSEEPKGAVEGSIVKEGQHLFGYKQIDQSGDGG